MTAAEARPPSLGTHIPISWATISVGELFEVVGGGTPDTKNEAFWQGDTPWISSADISPDGRITVRRHISGDAVRASATAIVPAGSLIVVTRVGLGKVALADRELCFSQDSQALLVGTQPVSIPYIAQYLRYAARLFRSQSRGTTIAGITKKQLLDVVIPLPPLPEQQRIVNKIEELFSKLDAGVAELKRTQGLLKRYRQSLLHAAVTGELTREWRQQQGGQLAHASHLLADILAERRRRWEERGKRGPYVELQGPDVAGLAELPTGWVWASIGQAFEVMIGSTPSRARPEYWGGDIAWVSSGEVAFCRIKRTRETVTNDGYNSSSITVHPVGTVLIGMIGEGKTRGQVAILDIEACNNQNSAAIRVSQTPISPEYVYYYLSSQYEQSRRAGAGNNQPALNKSRVENMLFPLPPVEEQAQIVAETDRRLSIIDNMEATVAAELRRAEATRQSILHRAFTGQLVPQDPSDEPASVLLESIQAEKVKAGAQAIRDGAGRRGRPKRSTPGSSVNG